ncbi:MAG: UDP-N-acetylmuramoyl-L-alanyl-D-glutamate--2,6-diaminopimelate ligase [Actinomycetota bacterium]|nr:UDP-N-acetylmuramoyl-L-alanyl-D-glutamate--2,6-diaminopimelate ligase [Actinomycetota bacterium]
MTTTTLQSLAEAIGANAPGLDIGVSGIAYRSDRVGDGDVFFCIPGFAHDGHDFAADAVARGAAALVVERLVDVAGDVPQVRVPDTRRALALGSAHLHGDPSGRMDVVGVTGTNGKTTTTYLVDSILRASGRVTGVIGTVETRIGGRRLAAARTTPESADLQALLSEMAEEGVSAVAMEVSSHAIDLCRVDGVHFAVAAFTNLTQDHLDYHQTIEEYWSVKKRLFTDMPVRYRVVNIDDPLGAGLAAELDEVLTVSIGGLEADVLADDVTLSAEGVRFRLVTPSGVADISLPLTGDYNVSNAAVAAGCAHVLGVDIETIARGLGDAHQVPGRLERIEEGQPFAVYVDYAHTPDSLAKAIAAVREVTTGRVLVVFGCGGDRDPEKRPMMGAAVSEGADHAIITSDNPRSEDPVGIVLQIEDGMRGGSASYEVELDRRRAISHALTQAVCGDSVLIAGKGHEDYQILADRTIHFDDREVAREELGLPC